MNDEINRINWKCRRGMREFDLLLREFSRASLKNLTNDELSIFDQMGKENGHFKLPKDLAISKQGNLIITDTDV